MAERMIEVSAEAVDAMTRALSPEVRAQIAAREALIARRDREAADLAAARANARARWEREDRVWAATNAGANAGANAEARARRHGELEARSAEVELWDEDDEAREARMDSEDSRWSAEVGAWAPSLLEEAARFERMDGGHRGA